MQTKKVKLLSRGRMAVLSHCVLIGTFAYLFVFALPGFAASSLSEASDSIRIREIMPMNFGYFVVEQGVGSVEVDARSGICRPNNAVMIRATCERGQFEIYGEPGARVMLQVIAGGAQSHGATIDNVAIHPADGVITIGSNGLAYAYIGGKVSVSRQTKSNTLFANYHVEANYLP